MNIYLVIELISLLFLTIYLVNKFKDNKTTIWITCIIIIAWYLSFVGIILLPTDIAWTHLHYDTSNINIYNNTISNMTTNSTNIDEYNNQNDPGKLLILFWKILYWFSFILAWIILPFLYEFYESGEWTIKERMKEAIRVNLKSILSLFVLIIVLLIIFMSTKHNGGIIALLMALGNTYGLLLIIGLMGYGLVALPRRLWILGNPNKRLLALQSRAGGLDNDLFDARIKLEDIERKIIDIKNKLYSNKSKYNNNILLKFEKILNKCKNFSLTRHEILLLDNNSINNNDLELRTSSFLISIPPLIKTIKKKKYNIDEEKDNNIIPDIITLKYLANIRKILKKIQNEYYMLNKMWETLAIEAIFLEDLKLKIYKKPKELSSSRSSIWHYFDCFWNYFIKLKYYWRYYIQFYFYRIIAFISLILSVNVLLFEFLLSLPISSIISPFLSLFNTNDDFFILQIFLLIPFLYMAICTFHSLFTFKVIERLALRSPNNTNSSALLFNAQFLVRIQFSLAFNYLLTLKTTTTKKTAFLHMMSDIDTLPVFGTGFTTYSALLVIIICLFTYFRTYTRLLLFLGFEHRDSYNLIQKESSGELDEGKYLLQKARKEIESNQELDGETNNPNDFDLYNKL